MANTVTLTQSEWEEWRTFWTQPAMLHWAEDWLDPEMNIYDETYGCVEIRIIPDAPPTIPET